MAKSSDVQSAGFRTSAPFSLSPSFPLISAFWNGYATLLDMQRQNFAAPAMRQRALGNIELGEAEHVIPVPREELQIGKRQVMSSKAFRVRTTVKEVPVEEHLDLRTESVVIERRPSTSPPGSDVFQESLVEVHEMHEEPVVAKVVRQDEEVVISKAVGTRRTTIRDVVRETHVEVDGETDHEGAEPESKRELALLDAAADKPENARSQTRAEPTKNRR
jgi:hypothetical protein